MVELRPHQLRSADHLEKILPTWGAALDGSDTGTGKTYTAVEVIRRLELPTLAVVPKISQTSWRRVGEAFGTEFDVVGWEKVRYGTSPYGRWQFPLVKRKEYLMCTRCFAREEGVEKACPHHPTGIHCVEVKKKPHNYGRFIWHPGVKFLIMDEIHRANAPRSLQAQMLIAAKDQGIPVLGLSATPACTPLHFRALGYMLGLHDLEGPNSFYAWSRRYKCGKHPAFKHWDWLAADKDKRGIMDKLHAQIFPARGVRVRYQEIPGFPERIIEPVLFDLEKSGRIDQLYKDMEASLEMLRQKQSEDADPDNPLTKLLRARQELELLKVPIIVEQVSDILEGGSSAAVFCNYSQTIAELSARLKCTAIIDGTRKDRQQVIDDFQDDRTHLVLVQSGAGGVSVSMHDVRGERPRRGLVMPDPDVVKMRQVFGRIHRDGGKSLAYYQIVLVAGTKEEQVYKKFKAKSRDLDALLDSDLVPDGCI